MIEQWWDGRNGEVRLLPFSDTLALGMEALREGLPLRWARTLQDRAAEPPPGLAEAWFQVDWEPRSPTPTVVGGAEAPYLRSPAEGGREPSASPEGVALSGDLLPEGQRYWVGLQTHWTVGPGREVWTSARGRTAARTSATLDAVASAVESDLRRRVPLNSGPVPLLRRVRPSRHRRRSWASGSRSLGETAYPLGRLREAILLVAPFPLDLDPLDDPRLRHAVVLGASGSGKTSALAHMARQALGEGRSVILFDVHGDLAPRIMAGLSPALRDRSSGVDVAGSPTAIPGLSVFGPVPVADREALVAHLVAALKRLSTENGETFWGFRLERLFETFLHIVQEQGGDLVDLWSLLADPRRREAARLSTHRPEMARFLEEVDGIVRRQPEFLWPAASRVAKVVGSPLLTALLAPSESRWELGERLAEGGSVLWRLPIGEIGPEGVTFAVTLLLTRVYLDLVRRAPVAGSADGLRALFVIDEAHLFPARLLSEIVAEGRKFGLGLIAATQYPARLAPELREAFTGAAGTVYLFRVPWAAAKETGLWAGLGPETAQQLLPSLPPGWAVVSSTGPNADRRLVPIPLDLPPDLPGWQAVVRRTAERYGSPVPYRDTATASSSDRWEEELLLGLVALDAEGGPVTRAR
ncbi:MAG TPA: helicase HerA-like domain-containing protein, partial [Thermoplasmata archaeon]|nr:helicase HerA-like domain-containing protein [Thermoplasmata archaeon]